MIIQILKTIFIFSPVIFVFLLAILFDVCYETTEIKVFYYYNSQDIYTDHIFCLDILENIVEKEISDIKLPKMALSDELLKNMIILNVKKIANYVELKRKHKILKNYKEKEIELIVEEKIKGNPLLPYFSKLNFDSTRTKTLIKVLLSISTKIFYENYLRPNDKDELNTIFINLTVLYYEKKFEAFFIKNRSFLAPWILSKLKINVIPFEYHFVKKKVLYNNDKCITVHLLQCEHLYYNLFLNKKEDRIVKFSRRDFKLFEKIISDQTNIIKNSFYKSQIELIFAKNEFRKLITRKLQIKKIDDFEMNCKSIANIVASCNKNIILKNETSSSKGLFQIRESIQDLNAEYDQINDFAVKYPLVYNFIKQNFYTDQQLYNIILIFLTKNMIKEDESTIEKPIFEEKTKSIKNMIVNKSKEKKNDSTITKKYINETIKKSNIYIYRFSSF